LNFIAAGIYSSIFPAGGVNVKLKKLQKKKYTEKSTGISKYNHEITGIILLSLGILIMLSFVLTGSVGIFGEYARGLLLGIIGRTAFLIPPLVIVYAVFVILKKNDSNFNLRAIYTVILLVLVSALLHTGSYNPKDYENLSAVKSIIRFFNEGKGLNGGGVIGGMISIPFLLFFQVLGTIILLVTLSIIDIILLTNISIANFIYNIRLFFSRKAKKVKKNRKDAKDSLEESGYEPDIIGEGENLKLEFRPKIIDFKIEKTVRELREKTDAPVSTGTDNLLYEDNIEPEEMVIRDLKDIKKKAAAEAAVNKSESPARKENISKEIKLNENRSGDYRYPGFDLLKGNYDEGKNARNHKNSAIEGAKKLEDTLKSFGVEAKVINVSRGPAVTRYELQPSPGVKVSRIVNLSDDISLNLASSGVRIEAPIPGKAAIGIEVPNKEMETVYLREVLETVEFTQHKSKLAFAIGKDISGENIIGDIAKMPHLLIAGATGAGKSVCINSIIISLLYKSSPGEVKLLMVDPKVVELGIYNGIPHLLIPVVTDPRKAAGALNWAVQEMINRYKLFAERGARDIKGYNALLKESGEIGLLPEIVIIIDELADLMMVAPNEVEDSICRLAQMARAAGMHLVIATQRPSVDVITGVIKANIPSRIAFAVTSQVDSRTILDMAGAEKLLGKGDMLFYPVGEPKPIRIKCAFVTDKEVESVVSHIKSMGSAEYNEDIIEEINNENTQEENDPGDNDELLPQAIELVVEAGQASVSLIQRKFKVGYARAARIVDQMEERGVVGRYEGSKPRQVLMTRQQLQEKQMSDNSQ